jgi:hypothetical protein
MTLTVPDVPEDLLEELEEFASVSSTSLRTAAVLLLLRGLTTSRGTFRAIPDPSAALVLVEDV